MPAVRLPLTELVTALKTRIEGLAPAIKVFTLAKQGEARPYLELGDLVFQDQGEKDAGAVQVQIDLHAYSNEPNMKEVNAMLSAALRAITSTGIPLEGGFETTNPLVEGSGSVRKEADTIGVFWHGQVTLSFVISDNQGGVEV